MLILFFNTLLIVSFKVRDKGSLAFATETGIKNSVKKYRESLKNKIFFMNRRTPKGERVETIIFKGSFKRNGKKRPFYGALPSSFSKPNGLIKQLFYNILSDILERGLISFC